jgi:hypothetical protein
VIAHGTGLRQVSTVVVAGNRTYDFTPLSSHRLKITLPEHEAGRVAIRIGGAWGLSNKVHFTYVGAPTVAGLTPNQGPAGATQTVVITGTGFRDSTGTGLVTGVSVGGMAATFDVTSPATIAATLPALPAGSYPVVVTTEYGTSASWVRFTYLAPDAGGAGGSGSYRRGK